MELIRGLHNVRAGHRGGAATIGNFDGVHRGHQAVIARVVRQARRQGCVSTVIIFEPTPAEHFSLATAPARLTRFAEKVRALRGTGVDQLLCLRFDAFFAGLEPDVFADEVLVRGLGVRRVVVGDDFRYGRKRAGDYQSLQATGEAEGFEVAHMDTFSLDGDRVSSTAVRAALSSGNLQRARVMLGRPYAISGRVIRGQQLGRQLGYPTANIALKRGKSALHGIFAVRVSMAGNMLVDGVASLGQRPTVEGDHDLLEVHLFDFDKDIYGEHISVHFFAKIREEERFSGLEAMIRQMRVDERHARHIMARYPLLSSRQT